MEQFSVGWKSSSRASKQRKYRLNSPLHIKRELLSSQLSKVLADKYGRRSVTLREGDTVKVMKGQFKGLTGKVSTVKLKRGIVYVDGAERTRKDGTKSSMPLWPSSLLVVDTVIEDNMRIASLTRKSVKK